MAEKAAEDAATKAEVEEAAKECETAIKECEDAALSCRYLLSVCVIIIILLGSLLVYLNLPYSAKKKGDETLMVYYMMPANCRDCDLGMVGEVSAEVGVTVEKVVSDSVQRPNLLIVSGNKSTLASASSRFNILSALCFFASHEKSCELRNQSREDIVDCLSKYNITKDTVIMYTQYECSYCKNMSVWGNDLVDEGYRFGEIDVIYKEDKDVADKCLSSILDLKGVVPQFICPATGANKMGAFSSKEEMKRFAENCRSA